VRLQIRRQQTRADDIVLLYSDEAEALTLPYLAHAWANDGLIFVSRKVAMTGVT
jgi:hypothetical protein